MSFTSRRVISPRVESTGLTPMQVARAMGMPCPGDANWPGDDAMRKRTVAILELGGAFKLTDVTTWCAKNNIEAPNLTAVFVDGATGVADPNGADGEVSLDICIVAAVAQKANIVVVFAPNSNQGFIDGLAKCVELNPDAISISWGSPTDTWDTTSMTLMDNSFMDAEEKGITPYVAAGDNGSSDGETFKTITDYPASSPYVIACGGTRLELNADGTRASETAWSTSLLNSSGGGGGVNSVYPTPGWQESLPGTLPAGRKVPDLAGNADPATGYLVEVDGTPEQIGGTSAVAPFMAAFQCILNAIKNERVGNMHAKLYAHPECFFDVTEGTNGAYKAEAGFDMCTGLGVLNGNAFIKAIS